MHVACKNRLWNRKGLVYNIKEYLFVIYVQIRPIKKLSSIIVSTSPSLSSSLSSSSFSTDAAHAPRTPFSITLDSPYSFNTT